MEPVKQWSKAVQKSVEEVQQKVEEYVRSSPAFQEACGHAFMQVDARGTGRVSSDDAALAARFIFRELSTSMQDVGIAVQQPAQVEVVALLQKAGHPPGSFLDRQQFEDVYVAVLKDAAAKCATGFAQKYGIAILAGIGAVVLTKRAVRALPLVGGVAGTLLGLLPALLVGPALGVWAVWTRDQGDILALPKLLRARQRRGQFRAE